MKEGSTEMTLYAENETEISFPFSVEEIATAVINAVLDAEECPYTGIFESLVHPTQRFNSVNSFGNIINHSRNHQG